MPSPNCPVAAVVGLVHSRWTTPVLWTLDHHGPQRFVELQRRIGDINPKMLTDRLRHLERHGLVTRTYHREIPPRVEYAVTPLARTLAPLFAALTAWQTRHLPQVEAARRGYDATGD
ncbi:HxlR family transcriptional regulator [Streptomyces sp. TLI_171]|nr:helix-turn-helix domain-containing protein [Streptomyces sp. TLI_171]RKE19863.1 HxlR family transcriptional regulator [Streptomyces sp. TLI_171]